MTLRVDTVGTQSPAGKISGRTAWNLDELRELATIFEVTTDYLIGNESIESAEPTKAKVPTPPVTSTGETGTTVAGTGFEPATSGSFLRCSQQPRILSEIPGNAWNFKETGYLLECSLSDCFGFVAHRL